MRKAAFALVLAALAAVLVGSLVKPRRATAGSKLYPEPAAVLKQIQQYRDATWRWQRVMGMWPTPASDGARTDPSLRYRLWVRSLWKGRAARMRWLALNPPHKSAWLCIHRYEGSWGDAGPLYYGGLQMDLSFQRQYGGYLLAHKGTAEHWSPLEQMWVAERALRSGRGFYPWPHTARACGLI